MYEVDDPIIFDNMAFPQYPQEMLVVATGRTRLKQSPLEAEWSTHQSEITRLYIREDESLDNIMRDMRTKYGFHATYTTNYSCTEFN